MPIRQTKAEPRARTTAPREQISRIGAILRCPRAHAPRHLSRRSRLVRERIFDLRTDAWWDSHQPPTEGHA